MRDIAITLVMMAAVFSSACGHQESGTAGDANRSEQAPARTDDAATLNEQIVVAIQRGDYAEAIRMTRTAAVAKLEVDFAAGQLILEGLADPQATHPPVETVAAGLSLIEASAMAGHEPAIFGMAATFYTGLRVGNSDGYLIAPDQELNACWEAAKEKREQVPSCIAMRTQR